MRSFRNSNPVPICSKRLLILSARAMGFGPVSSDPNGGRTSEPVVRRLVPDNWAIWRAARLAARADAPMAFASSAEQEAAYDEAWWRERMTVGVWVAATTGGEAVGIAGGYVRPDREGTTRLVSMWVRPSFRGQRIAESLAAEVIGWSREQWVGGGRAVGDRRQTRVPRRYTRDWGSRSWARTNPTHSILNSANGSWSERYRTSLRMSCSTSDRGEPSDAYEHLSWAVRGPPVLEG
jgi:GNAT superfamily N-acetyltransferase